MRNSKLFDNKKKKLPLEHRMNISMSLVGSRRDPLSYEHREKISKSLQNFTKNLSPKEALVYKQKGQSLQARGKRAMTIDAKRGAGFVYVVATSTTPGWYKVGVGNVFRRLREARTWLPGKVRLIGYALVDKPYTTEYVCHTKFPTRSEWVKTHPRALFKVLEEVSGAVFTRGHSLTPPHHDTHAVAVAGL